MRDSKEYLTATAGQWTGSLLCEHEFVVFVIVCGRQKEGGSCGFVVVVGLLGGGETPGASQCPWWKHPESSRPASLLKSELQDVVSLLNSL